MFGKDWARESKKVFSALAKSGACDACFGDSGTGDACRVQTELSYLVSCLPIGEEV